MPLRLSAEASGRAIDSVEIKSAREPEAIRLVLRPARPVRLRVLDAQDEPVAGAVVSRVEWRMPRHVVPWTGVTDRDGRAVWPNAPLDLVVLRVTAANAPYQFKNIRVDPTNRDVVVRLQGDLSRGDTLRIRAVEEDSG